MWTGYAQLNIAEQGKEEYDYRPYWKMQKTTLLT
jgi:hypothetical protein